MIFHLQRKPGASRNYQFRDELFPRLVFRQAHDVLVKELPEKCDKEYLKILNQAALGEEGLVALALQEHLIAGEVPLSDSVRALCTAKTSVPNVEVLSPTLEKYDRLIKGAHMNGISRQSELEAHLTSFRLPSFSKNYQQFARQAEKEKIDHVGYLYELAKLESEDRYNRRTERLLRQSRLPKGKRLEDFDLSVFTGISQSQVQELADGGCLDVAENILIFGNPGTGKTHLSAALGREWCMRGRHTYFHHSQCASSGFTDCKTRLAVKCTVEKIRQIRSLDYRRHSYIPQDRDETDVLFVLLSERYERRSLVITSNLPFSQWDKVFKDSMTTMAAVDRLVHHSTVLELNGESFRVQAATKKSNNKKGQN